MKNYFSKKRGREKLLKRVMAVMLSFALTAEMASGGAIPAYVLAQESVSESAAEIAVEEPEADAGTQPAEWEDVGAETDKEIVGTQAAGKDETKKEEAVASQKDSGQEPETAEPDAATEELEDAVESGEVQDTEELGEAAQEMMLEEAAGVQAYSYSSGTDWTLDYDGRLTIESDTGMTDWTANRNSYAGQVKSVDIQSGVTAINEMAFTGCMELTDIEIPSGVTSIEGYAFNYCTKLTTVKLPDGVISIGTYAFQGCENLVDIKLSSGLKTIDEVAFADCTKLTDIEIPASVESIGVSAFQSCANLTSVTMQSETPPTLGSAAFGQCKFVKEGKKGIYVPAGSASAYKAADVWRNYAANITDTVITGNGWTLDTDDGRLTIESDTGMADWCSGRSGSSSHVHPNQEQVKSVEIKDGVTSIGDYAFYKCENLMDINIPYSVESIGAAAFETCSSLTGIEIPSGVTSIGASAFMGCSSLTSIKLPTGVTSIAKEVFSSCSELASIELPSGVESIGMNAFTLCKSLTSIELPLSVTSIGNAAFNGCSNLASIELPSGVKTIAASAFKGCSSLTSIKLPTGVTTIGDNVFMSCSSLTSIEIPLSVTSIGGHSFNGCSSLTSIELPSSVTSIGRFAFFNCSSLASIELPSGVTSINVSAFSDCSSLLNVTMQSATPPTLGDSAFSNCKFVTTNKKGICVPKGCVDVYKATKGWSAYAAYITDDIASGEGWVLDGSGRLIIESDTGMANWCSQRDSYQQQVTSVEIKDGVTSIVQQAFYECGNLTSIDIETPSSVESIGDYAFSGCSKLTSIEIPSGVTYIGNSAFTVCFSLASVTMQPTMPPRLGTSAFLGCGFVMANEKGIHVPEGCVDDYKADENWSAYKDYITDGVPEITTQPTSQTIQNGKTVTFSVSAEDEGTLTYKWQVNKNDGNGFNDINGAASATYTIAAVDRTYNGYKYRCVITNDKGSVTSDEVSLTVTDSDADKVASAKTAVQTVLDDYTATNATTKADIQTAIDTALSSAGITGVTVTVGEITKTDATSDTAGSISGSIAIECGSESDTVTISKTIPQLPPTETDADKVAAAKSAVQTVLDNYTATNATTKTDIQTAIDGALSSAGITGITVIVGEITKTDATTSAEGSISGTITITCGSESDTVTISKNIAQLPLTETDADKVAAAKTAVQTVLDNYTATNATTKAEIQTAIDAALSNAGIAGVTVTVGEITKTDATTDTAGSISGSITITCGSESDTVSINATIAQLPLTETDADKVAAAKTAVQTVLDNYTATNATTKVDIQTAIDAALSSAGITGVTVTVGEITKTDATTDTAGSISGSIAIECGSESDTVSISKSIAQLPPTETDADKVAAAKTAVQTVLGDYTATNATIKADIQTAIDAALSNAGITGVTVTVGDITKTEATTDTAGSVSGTITITSGSESDTVTISKTIAKLPSTTLTAAEKAAKAKAAVEAALSDLTVNNDTTQESVKTAIVAAITDALAAEEIDINDITIEVEDFNKTEATTSAAGSVSGTIKITVETETVQVPLSKTIEKTGSRTGLYVLFTDYDELSGEDSVPCYKYTGNVIKPDVEVYYNQTRLTLGRDYAIAYKNNKKPGPALLTVRGRGSFSGPSEAVGFTIINADIKNDTSHPTEMTVIKGTKVAPVIMNGTKKLNAKDYELTGTGLTNGKYTAVTVGDAVNVLTVKGIGNYEGSSFDINVKVVERNSALKLAVAIDKNYKPIYNGSEIDLKALFTGENNENGMITVTDFRDKTKILKEGKDFSVVCTSSLKNAGTVKLRFVGMGEYTGSVSKSFRISPLKAADNSKFEVKFDENKEYEYKAAGTEVDNLIVKYLGETDAETDDLLLKQGIDYKVSYSNNKKVSGSKDAALKISFIGNYKGSAAISKTFKVKVSKISSANTIVTVPDMVYRKDGKAYKSKPIVTVDGVTIKASAYNVSYKWATASEMGDETKYTDGNKITIAAGDNYAKVKVTVTPKENGSYTLADGVTGIEGEYYVRKGSGATELTRAKVTFYNKAGEQLKKLEYNGNTFYTPTGNNLNAADAPDDANAVYVKVSVKGKEVDAGLYDVIWTNAKAKGKATVVIRGKGTAAALDSGSDTGTIAVGSKKQSISIKAMALKGKSFKTYMEKAADILWNKFF